MMEIFEKLLYECSDLVSIIRNTEKGTFLTRDVKRKVNDISYLEYDISSRTPLNTSNTLHSHVNEYFQKELGWPVRNGLFSYGVNVLNMKDHRDIGYGKTYLLFPVDSFQYCYDKNVKDLSEFEHFYRKDHPKCDEEEICSQLNYSDENLEEILNLPKYVNRSVEIMINCKGYYLIDLKFAEKLIDKIWNI